MKRLALVPLTLLAATAAYADDIPTPAVRSQPLPYPHSTHAMCHQPKYLAAHADVAAQCAPILKSEKDGFVADVARVPAATIMDADGARLSGRRDSSMPVMTGSTSETTFSANAWLTRFNTKLVDGESAHPAFEDASIDSCDEYAYKRYYQANRVLDALGRQATARRFDLALDTIANGVRAYGPAHAVSGLANAQLLDFDGHAITSFDPFFHGAQLKAFAPLHTGAQPRNVFYGLPATIGFHPVATHDAAWEADLRSAMTASRGEPTVMYPATGEWGYAQVMRVHPDIAGLSVGERDDVTRRVSRMRSAIQRAMHGFQGCVLDRWQIESAATSVGYMGGLALRDYVEANQPGAGYTDPQDALELDLQARLLDDTLAAATLQQLLAASPTALDLAGSWARTRTGALLRSLAAYDQATLSSVLATTRTTFKSATTSTGSSCSMSDDFETVRELLVEEYRRHGDGCMSSNRRCDFSPELFVDDVTDRLTAATFDIDAAKAFCTKVLGSSFDGTISPVPAAPRADLADFEAYLRAKQAELVAVLRDTPHDTSLPNAIGDRRDGGSTWGNPSRFAAGYHYGAEWAIDVTRRNLKTKDPCQLGGKVSGNLNAYVTAFGETQDLVDAGLDLETTQPGSGPKFAAHVTLLDYDVFTFDEPNLPDHYDAKDGDTKSFTLVHTTVVLGFVPVSIDVAINFDYGYDFGLKFTQTACVTTPAISIDGSLAPHAGAGVSLTAYVDLFLVGAGVKGELTLLDASLPFSASVAVKPNPADDGWLAVFANSSLDLRLQELSGAVSFVVKFLDVTVWEHELFSWPGLRQKIGLWHESATFPLRGFDQL